MAPYSYWSNWDAPAGIAELEGEQRGLAWQRVLPDYAPPVEAMLTFTLRTEANPGTMMLSAVNGGETDPVLSQVPDRPSRALRVAIHSYVAFLVTEGGLGTEVAADATRAAAQLGDLKYSVTIDRYTGGPSINDDSTNMGRDCFHSTFMGNVSIETDSGRAWREEEAAKAKARKAQRASR